DEMITGIIVETEAYGGAEDLASHAAFRKTGYVTYMTGPSGTLYVYKAYGTYPCLNIVTGPEGKASAVLIRAISMQAPEPDDRSASGPGRLGRRIELSTAHNGHELLHPPFWIEPGSSETVEVATGPRVGVKRGDGRHWRFAIAGHPAVSRPRL
ncbi:MAG: DNA-3-methyladenine glycosylase, partial [Thermomicrobiaceae bacterium]